MNASSTMRSSWGCLLRARAGGYLATYPIIMTFTTNSDTFGTTGYSAIQNQDLPDIDTPTRINPETRAKWEKLCPNCREWIGLGGQGNPYSFLRHLDGGRCRHTAEMKALALAEEAPGPPVTSTSSGPKSLPMLATNPGSLYPNTLISESSLSQCCYGPPESLSTQPVFPCPDVPMAIDPPSPLPLASLPFLVLPEQTSRVSPTLPDTMVLDPLQVSPPPPSIPTNLPPITSPLNDIPPITSYPNFPTVTKVPCRGVRVRWECGHPSKTYPFQYHDTDNLTWSVTTQRPFDPIDTIYLQSFSCTLFHDTSTEACFECLKVPSSDKFRSLVLRTSKDPALTTPWGYRRVLCSG